MSIRPKVKGTPTRKEILADSMLCRYVQADEFDLGGPGSASTRTLTATTINCDTLNATNINGTNSNQQQVDLSNVTSQVNITNTDDAGALSGTFANAAGSLKVAGGAAVARQVHVWDATDAGDGTGSIATKGGISAGLTVRAGTGGFVGTSLTSAGSALTIGDSNDDVTIAGASCAVTNGLVAPSLTSAGNTLTIGNSGDAVTVAGASCTVTNGVIAPSLTSAGSTLTIGDSGDAVTVAGASCTVTNGILVPSVNSSGQTLTIGNDPDCSSITIGNTDPLSAAATTITIGGPLDTVTMTNATIVNLSQVNIENGSIQNKTIALNQATDVTNDVSAASGVSALTSGSTGILFKHYDTGANSGNAKDEWTGKLVLGASSINPDTLVFQAPYKSGATAGGIVNIVAPAAGGTTKVVTEAAASVTVTSGNTGVLTVAATTEAISKDTGALVVAGGVGINGALYVDGSTSMTNGRFTGVLTASNTASPTAVYAAAATSQEITTAKDASSVVIKGGCSIYKNLFVGDAVNGATGTGADALQGNIYCTGELTAFSDERLKKDIVTIDGALDRVAKMRGVFFRNAAGGDRRRMGVVAQEVREVAPEVVVEAENGYYSVAYGNLVGVLIEAVKEQQKQIASLTKSIRALSATP